MRGAPSPQGRLAMAIPSRVGALGGRASHRNACTARTDAQQPRGATEAGPAFDALRHDAHCRVFVSGQLQWFSVTRPRRSQGANTQPDSGYRPCQGRCEEAVAGAAAGGRGPPGGLRAALRGALWRRHGARRGPSAAQSLAKARAEGCAGSAVWRAAGALARRLRVPERRQQRTTGAPLYYVAPWVGARVARAARARVWRATLISSLVFFVPSCCAGSTQCARGRSGRSQRAVRACVRARQRTAWGPRRRRERSRRRCRAPSSRTARRRSAAAARPARRA